MSNQRLQGWNPQKTGFTYAKDRIFGPGFRSGGLYADLGLAEATGGNFHAHLTKINPEKHSETGTTGMHRHDYDLQFCYMISGEIDFVIEGIDEVLTFRRATPSFYRTRSFTTKSELLKTIRYWNFTDRPSPGQCR